MLTFFRRIRKTLLGEGATSKYLLYAIGEIALVVIGILIALQINNWNEWRKDRKLEREVLTDVYSDLERNSASITRLILRNSQNNQSANRIISLIQNKQNAIDSLPFHLHNGRVSAGYGFFLSYAGYESLKNTGFVIIRNDTLMDAVLNLYEVEYPQIMNFAQTVVHPLFSDGNRLIDEHFITEDGGLLTPINLELTLNDMRYYVFLKRARGQRNAMNRHLRGNLNETEKVLQLIKDELGESNL